MMPGIVVGVDGSVHSQWALDWAVSEAASRHAPLTAVSVHHQRAAYTEGDLSLDQVVEELEALVDKAVSRRPGPAPMPRSCDLQQRIRCRAEPAWSLGLQLRHDPNGRWTG